MNSKNPISENDPTPNCGAESRKEANAPQPQIPPTPTKPEPQPSKTHCEITCKTEKNWWDKAKPFIETAGIVLLAVYTGYTIKMYYANKQAADAAKTAADTARDALEASKDIQAARLTLDIEPIVKAQADGQTAHVDWNPIITNAGGTIATQISTQAVLYDIRGAHGEYGEPVPVPKPIAQPSPSGDNVPPGKSRKYPVSSQITEWDKVLSQESTVIVRWNLSYLDIFNRPQVAPFCFFYDARRAEFLRCPPFTQSK